ncbi:MAG: OmpA family protein [Devosia sp.]
MTSPSASAATIVLFATLIATTCPVASRAADEMVTPEQIPIRASIFEFDSDVLNPASEPALRLASTILQRHPDWTVAVEGHTDIVGSRSYNLDLSSRRAQAFKTALVDRFGIEPARLATAGYGFDRPVATNDTVEGRAENRRVELVRPCGN